MDTELGLQLVIMCVFAVICALVAQSRGRSAIGWGVLGFLIGCIALIIVLVLPDLKVEEERRRRLMNENRRLREMVRSDRQLADQRHAETQQRIGAHDRALGVDTRPADQLGEGEGGVAPSIAAPGGNPELERQRASFAGTEWYFLETDDKQVGPLSFDEFKLRWRAGDFGAMSYVLGADLRQLAAPR